MKWTDLVAVFVEDKETIDEYGDTIVTNTLDLYLMEDFKDFDTFGINIPTHVHIYNKNDTTRNLVKYLPNTIISFSVDGMDKKAVNDWNNKHHPLGKKIIFIGRTINTASV